MSYMHYMKGKSVTFRPSSELRARLERLAKATERPLSWFISKAIEAELPALEEKYAEDLKKLPPGPKITVVPRVTSPSRKSKPKPPPSSGLNSERP